MKIFILCVLLITIGCKDEHSHHDHKHHAMPAQKATEGSLFDLEDSWKTQNEKSFQWKELKDEPFLVSMFYASCQSVCPRIVTDMQNISKKIQAKTGKVPKLVLVSFDPGRDTPAELKKYTAKMELGDNWYLLNGSDDSVRTISVLLGISYQKTTGNDFNHSTVISLVSKEGKILERIEGTGANSDSIIQKY